LTGYARLKELVGRQNGVPVRRLLATKANKTLSFIKPLFTLFAFAALFTLMSCGPKGYTAPNAASATAAHSVIAIIPPVVNIKGRKKDDPEALKAAAEADVYTFQQEMYSWMLRRNYLQVQHHQAHV
jgi:hypothetical protein